MVEDILSEPETLESAGKLLAGGMMGAMSYAITENEEKLENMDSLQALGAGGIYSVVYDSTDEIISHVLGKEPVTTHSDYPEIAVSYAATYKALDRLI